MGGNFPPFFLNRNFCLSPISLLISTGRFWEELGKYMKEQKVSKDFDRMIVEAVRENYSFFAWQSISGVVEKCELKVKAYRKTHNEIELELCAGQEERLAKVISGNRLLNIYVPELSVSFCSEIKSSGEDKRIKLSSPSEFVFYERRKHERVQPSKVCYVNFEHNKQAVRKPVYDFSLGGIALLLSKTERINVEKGKVLNDFVVEVGLRKIKVTAECVNSIVIERFKLENLPYGGFKIGFRFTNISAEDKQYLQEFITHEKIMAEARKKAV